MKPFAVVAFVLTLGCGPLYRVEPRDGAKQASEDEDWKTFGVYRLPRTDLRMDAEVAISRISPGQHYCFGEVLEMGEGAIGRAECATTCLPAVEVVPLVRKLEITPVTVPDASKEYVYKIRNKRKAAKRTAQLTTTSTGLISGSSGGLAEESTGIALGAFKGGPHKMPPAFRPFGDASEGTTPTCQNIERSAERAVDEYHAKSACLKRLGETPGAMAKRWDVWKQYPQCRRLANVFRSEFEGDKGGEAVDKLGPQVESIEASFRTKRTSETYSLQEWIRVERVAAPDATPPNLAPGHPVGLCRGENKTVTVCSAEGNSPMVTIALKSLVDDTQTGSQNGDAVLSSLNVGEGLQYRLPKTFLLQVELRPVPGIKTSPDALQVRFRQVKPVTFPQLGPIVVAPDRLKATPASIRMSLSEETGMLTNVELSLEPVMRKREGKGTLKTVQTLTYDTAPDQGAAAAASKLEQDNRLLRAQRENDCLRGLRDDCTEGEAEE